MCMVGFHHASVMLPVESNDWLYVMNGYFEILKLLFQRDKVPFVKSGIYDR